MKAATIHEIKQELATEKQAELIALCLRLARFKKENKELLTYLLFEAHNEQSFIEGIKAEVEELFAEMNKSHLHYVKKTLRKILRIITKYCRYSGAAETETTVRIYFCIMLKDSGIAINRDKIIARIYQTQLVRINTLINGLHEDLQYDFKKTLNELM